VVGVLPCLRKHPVVPIDVVRVEPELALFGILLDRVRNLIGSHLHLGRGLLGDLADKMEGAVFGVEGNIMPSRDGGALGVVENTELKRVSRALQYNIIK
jgi:hypothetical protein